jgi:hypothetical protein
MGRRFEFHSGATNVRFGSKTDIATSLRDVCFTPLKRTLIDGFLVPAFVPIARDAPIDGVGSQVSDSQPAVVIAMRRECPHIHLQYPKEPCGKPLALCRGEETFMFTPNQFRAKAAEYAELLKNTENPSEIKEFQRSKQSFSRLAHNEDWLAANFDKIIHSQEGRKSADRTVAEIEEHILRCLGAALIMHWNTIPTKLQRELFDTAGSLGELLKTAALRGQIARFLHDHKDD